MSRTSCHSTIQKRAFLGVEHTFALLYNKKTIKRRGSRFVEVIRRRRSHFVEVIKRRRSRFVEVIRRRRSHFVEVIKRRGSRFIEVISRRGGQEGSHCVEAIRQHGRQQRR